MAVGVGDGRLTGRLMGWVYEDCSSTVVGCVKRSVCGDCERGWKYVQQIRKAVWHGNEIGLVWAPVRTLPHFQILGRLRIGAIGLERKKGNFSNDCISHREQRNLAKILRLDGSRRKFSLS